MKRSCRRSPKRLAARYLSILLILALGATMLRMGSFVESRVFFYPSRQPFVTPEGVRDVSILTPEGHTLHAWVMGPEDSDAPVILHIHGNAGNVSTHADFSWFLAQAGYRVVLFDYRGYGRSEPAGRVTRARALTDAQAALDWVKSQEEFVGAPIGVYGVSLGGAIGLPLAARNEDVRAVCATSAFASWRGVASDHAPMLAPLLISRGQDPVDAIAELGDRPVLLVHGGQDAIVPVHHLEILASASRVAGVSVETALIPLGGHNDVPHGQGEAMEAVLAFFRERLGLSSR